MSGKLIFTEFHKEKLALLFGGGRLLAVQALSESNGRIGAIYVGKIKSVAKNIDACFVEIANGEICFLPLKEARAPFLLNRTYDGRLIEGDELAVQIVREAQKTKQASLSARISVSNDFFALSLDGSSRVGYSNKLSTAKKQELQSFLAEKGILEGKQLSQKYFSAADTPNFPLVGAVVRTRAGECGEADLLMAFQGLAAAFLALLCAAPYRICYTCLLAAPPAYQTVLDTFAYPYEYDEILTDNSGLFEQLQAFCLETQPEKKVRLYTDETYPLHKLYSIETRLNEALAKRVWLKSGGYLVIEPTEALTVIDVNSGKYEGRDNAYHVNIEAAAEIAFQLRLRNLSGMIVVDFINMDSPKLEASLLQELRKLVQKDKLKTHVVDITPLGLVEITRKKGNKPLHEQLQNIRRYKSNSSSKSI